MPCERHERVKIRAGIHVGQVLIDQQDAIGAMVNYTACVERCAKKAEIWLSNRAKEEIDQAKAHQRLRWIKRSDCELKGFPGTHILWSVSSQATSTPEGLHAPTPETGDSLRSLDKPEGLAPARQERVLDAAIAKCVAVKRPTELVAMVRQPASAGLKGIARVEEKTIKSIEIEEEGYSFSGEHVVSKVFPLVFPLDSDGTLQPVGVTVTVDSPDFEPKTQSKRISILPEGDSETYSFLLTPQYAGELRLVLTVCKDEVTIASRSLRISAKPSHLEAAESGAKILVMADEFRGTSVAARSGTTPAQVDDPVVTAIATARSQLTAFHAWDPAQLEKAETDLAAYIGPVAKVIVRRAAKTTQSLRQLYETLALEIPSPSDRQKFLATRTL
jgi:hypothetical protein